MCARIVMKYQIIQILSLQLLTSRKGIQIRIWQAFVLAQHRLEKHVPTLPSP